MPLDTIRTVLSRRPAWVVAVWVALALVVGLTSPSLTRLAAEGQSKLLGRESESRRAAELVRRAWPDQAYESTAVLALHRPSGLTEADRRFAVRLAERFVAPIIPVTCCGCWDPRAFPRSRLDWSARTGPSLCWWCHSTPHMSLPAAHRAIAWLQSRANEVRREASGVAGLELRWTGDAVIGRDYMAQVQASLDRAAVATVGLLLIVLLLVYRSFFLALVPLLTIGISLIIARGWLAWLDPGRLGGFSPGRAVPGGAPLRHGHRFLSLLVLAVRRAFQSQEPRRGDEVDAQPVVHAPGDERGDDHRRPLADGDDEVQALLDDRAERRAGAGAVAPGDADA